MKLKFILAFLVIGLIAFTSCDEVKKAYHDTFKSSEEKQNDLAEIFSGNSSDRKEVKAKRALIEEYSRLLDAQLPELNENKKDKMLEIISRDIDKRRRTEVSLLFLPEKLDEIQAGLYHFLNTEEVSLYSSALFVEDDRVRVTAVNPNNENEVDWYYYETKTGKWRKEDPVKLSRQDMERMDEKEFPLSSIKLSTAHTVFFEALKLLTEIEGAELPSSLTYYHHSHKKYWNVTLSGSRADYKLEADVDGRITKFEMR